MKGHAGWGNSDDELSAGSADEAVEEAAEEGPIRVVLVDPRTIHGAGVRELLEREDDFQVVAAVRTTEEAVSVSAERPPDVLVVDVDLPDPGAIEATRRLKRNAPDTGIVIIGRDADDE